MNPLLESMLRNSTRCSALLIHGWCTRTTETWSEELFCLRRSHENTPELEMFFRTAKALSESCSFSKWLDDDVKCHVETCHWIRVLTIPRVQKRKTFLTVWEGCYSLSCPSRRHSLIISIWACVCGRGRLALSSECVILKKVSRRKHVFTLTLPDC